MHPVYGRGDQLREREISRPRHPSSSKHRGTPPSPDPAARSASFVLVNSFSGTIMISELAFGLRWS
jgi:hypothetical protein